jgi:Flp pilus assembly protein TadB
MSDRTRAGSSGGQDSGLAVLAAAAVVVFCCAGLPIAVVLLGSVAIGTLLGVGAGVLAAVVVVALAVLGLRRRRRTGGRSGSPPVGVKRQR